MTPKQVNHIIRLLKEKGITFDKGLSDHELEQVEVIFQITFPKDLQLILQTALPTSSGFVHWRYGIRSKKGKQEIEHRLKAPKEGILFDIRYNNFWCKAWGEKPTRYEMQKKIALHELSKQPPLLPLYSHRYISSIPNDIGNPVFSIHQTDIILYGIDLIDYFSHEFKLSTITATHQTPKHIPFWSDLIQ